MPSLNKVILIGHLGADPELRYTSEGKAVCTMNVATNRSYLKGTEKKEVVNWTRVVAWGKVGEVCKQYLSKGGQIYVEGRLENRSYKDKATDAKKFTSEVVSSTVLFLGRKGGRDGGGMGREHVIGESGEVLSLAELTGEPPADPEPPGLPDYDKPPF